MQGNSSGATQLSIGTLVERGSAQDTNIEWGEIHPWLADSTELHGAMINSGAINPAKFYALVAQAERGIEKAGIGQIVAYDFPGVGMRWVALPMAMATVLRSIASKPGITSDDMNARHHGLDARTRVSELRSGGFIIAGRRDDEHPRLRRYELVGNLVTDPKAINSAGWPSIAAAMPTSARVKDALFARADAVAARTKANVEIRLAKLAKRSFVSSVHQLELFPKDPQ